MEVNKTKRWVAAALLAALTCICTMLVKIPTPTGGYIHPGDGMVLLCGIILGPGMGALAAGIGSMLSDLFSGYLAWVPATFIIKALSAMAAAILFPRVPGRSFYFHFYIIKMDKIKTKRKTIQIPASEIRLILAGIAAEALMVLGYFIFEIGLNAAANGGFTAAAIAGGVAYSAAGIPANIIQGVTGVVIAALLLPVLGKVQGVSELMYDWTRKSA